MAGWPFGIALECRGGVAAVASVEPVFDRQTKPAAVLQRGSRLNEDEASCAMPDIPARNLIGTVTVRLCARFNGSSKSPKWQETQVMTESPHAHFYRFRRLASMPGAHDGPAHGRIAFPVLSTGPCAAPGAATSKRRRFTPIPISPMPSAGRS